MLAIRSLERPSPSLHCRLVRGSVTPTAFVAFVVHQVVLVGIVLATRHVRWAPEIELPIAAAIAVFGSFGIGALLVRLRHPPPIV